MNNNTDSIERRLREEADRFLGQPPAQNLVRTLRARRQRRDLKRVAFVAAGLLLMFTVFAGYRVSQWEPTVAKSPHSPRQSSAPDVSLNATVPQRVSVPAPDRAAITDHDLSPAVEAVSYDSLTPAEQFAVRRFLETETGLRSTEFQEISL